jgi:hypothetical protein
MTPAVNCYFSTEGFDSLPTLVSEFQSKVAGLIGSRSPAINGVYVHVKREANQLGTVWFVTRAIIEKTGASLVAHAAAHEPMCSVDRVFNRLGRELSSEARRRKLVGATVHSLQSPRRSAGGQAAEDTRNVFASVHSFRTASGPSCSS